MNAEEKTNRHDSRYGYYHCTRLRPDYRRRQPYVQVASLEAQIRRFLEEISISDRFLASS